MKTLNLRVIFRYHCTLEELWDFLQALHFPAGIKRALEYDGYGFNATYTKADVQFPQLKITDNLIFSPWHWLEREIENAGLSTSLKIIDIASRSIAND